MADAKRRVLCPGCGNFVMKESIEGTVEINCRNKRCQAILEITVRSGIPTVTVLSTKKA
jgi:phage FluMu protein Com